MEINKALCAGIVFTGALTVIGCGSDSDSDVVINNENSPVVNNEFEYTEYELFSEIVNDEYQDAWGKSKYLLSENGLREEISTVVGSSSTSYQDNKDDYNDLNYYAGDNFFIAAPVNFDSNYYKVDFLDNNTLRLKIEKDNAAINSTYDILTYNIAGTGKFKEGSDVGIYTDLNYFYFPDTVGSFPAGSKCYVLQETPEQSSYNFYSYALGSNQKTVAQWLEQKGSGGYEINDLVKENIGQDNKLKAVRFTDKSGIIYAAVEFNSKVYEADYIQKGVKEDLDTNPKKSIVDCSQYNDTAAAFLDSQIKANYK